VFPDQGFGFKSVDAVYSYSPGMPSMKDSRITQGTEVPLQILEFSSSESPVVSVIFLGGITMKILK
mgnify:CR=1